MMTDSDPMRQRLLAAFQVELEDHASALNADLMALEDNPPADERARILEELFRAAHSLKGAARAVNLRVIEVVTHGMEDVLASLARADGDFAPQAFDTLFLAVDFIVESMAAALENKNLEAGRIDALLNSLHQTAAGLDSTQKPKPAPVTQNQDKPGPKPSPRQEAAPQGAPPTSAPLASAQDWGLLDDDDEPDSGNDEDLWAFSEKQHPPETEKDAALSQGLAFKPSDGTSGEPLPENIGQPPAPSAVPARRQDATGQTKDPAPVASSGQPPATPDMDGAPVGVYARPASGNAEETIRVRTAKLDALMAHLGELMVARMGARQGLARLLEQSRQIWRMQREWSRFAPLINRVLGQSAGNSGMASLAAHLKKHGENLSRLNAQMQEISSRFAADHDRLALASQELQDGVRRARMLPVSTLFDQFPRMVRDLARQLGKEVKLAISGEHTEVDRKVLEAVKDSLVHLVRNAVDHGIEPPQAREDAGKPRCATIWLRAEQQGAAIVIDVADDGRGMDTKKLVAKAAEKGVITKAQAGQFTDEEALELIFISGFSTHNEISDISGRGVGLDVVRESLKQLQGMIQVETEPGEGTLFTLTMPLSLATSQVLLVKTAGQTVALPTLGVERILEVAPRSIGTVEGKPAVTVEGRPLPLLSLARILEFLTPDEPDPDFSGSRIPVVVCALAEKRFALVVDSFGSTQEVVIKSLGRQLARVRFVAGGAILGDGRVVVILSLADLAKARPDETATRTYLSCAQMKQARRVLVADASLASRSLLKGLLENAGLMAHTAADTLSAKDFLARRGADLLLARADQPEIAVKELAAALRSQPDKFEAPLVLLVHNFDERARIAGLHAGADAFVARDRGGPQAILDAVQRLLGR
ncbi:MAG: hybrid sensor histidine kinase/response regulator [Desulfatibacillaceae bacterium]|nr:hybrid sensor histidine kinase/response regulator [Desulfatibacillaceae bacterium]